MLPVLYGNRFIARFEPAQDKKAKALIIKNWWWEKDIKISNAMENTLIKGFSQFLEYLDLENVTVLKDANGKKTLKWTEAV